MHTRNSILRRLQTKHRAAGFTLIEILVVIGIIALLATIVIVAINPARQFAQTRNTQRTSHVNSILNAIGQRMADNKGLFRQATDAVCTSGMDIPTTAVDPNSAVYIKKTGGVDMRPCLVTTYISELPVDPTDGVPYNAGTGDYDTGYKVFRDAVSGRITVFASTTEPTLGNVLISVTR
jgi:type IV pilus assembly protein PilA